MARNSEKAQSMLYRFRETQAIEMGMGDRQKGERRPRMASSVTNLRDCERWRGDIMRDISRKVSKIQDSGLTDYQIRDLNDEINNLLREKRHFETQIVNLGGANYKRGNASMLDDEGKEVPGTRGYKYFGRARELPGVKEMFTKSTQQASEESARNASFQMFRNQGPEYYGDFDEADDALAEEEEQASRAEWEVAVARTSAILNLPESTSVPYPASSSKSTITDPAPSSEAPKPKGKGKKRTKAEIQAEEEETAKKPKGEEQATIAATSTTTSNGQAGLSHDFLSMLDPESLKHPTLPSVDEMSKVLLEVRKNAIRAEYGV